jgi:predicted nucleic acid-binding protein
MVICYLDTSAALKLLISEAESNNMRRQFDAWLDAGHVIVASWLLHTEMHCAARRRGTIDPENVDAILAAVELVDLERPHLQAAAESVHGLRSADAIHLVTAVETDADAMVTYDKEVQAASRHEGLRVLAPSRDS